MKRIKDIETGEIFKVRFGNKLLSTVQDLDECATNDADYQGKSNVVKWWVDYSSEKSTFCVGEFETTCEECGECDED